MKLLMLPHYNDVGLDNGVGQTVFHYHKYLPQVGVEIITNPDEKFDLSASHLGHYPQADIHFSHGLYWGHVSEQMHSTNAQIITAIKNTKAIVVPSDFVAETFRRDFRIEPYIIPHGINYKQWQHNYKSQGYILWNKNRTSNVCNPQAIYELASIFPDKKFVTTYPPINVTPIDNIAVCGKLPFAKMKPIIQQASIYLATVKETFGIGILEALASGVPVLAFNRGGAKDIITHKKDGYLVNPYNINKLADGLIWLLENRKKLKSNCITKAKTYNWLNAAQKIKGVCKDVIEKMYEL